MGKVINAAERFKIQQKISERFKMQEKMHEIGERQKSNAIRAWAKKATQEAKERMGKALTTHEEKLLAFVEEIARLFEEARTNEIKARTLANKIKQLINIYKNEKLDEKIRETLKSKIIEELMPFLSLTKEEKERLAIHPTGKFFFNELMQLIKALELTKEEEFEIMKEIEKIRKAA